MPEDVPELVDDDVDDEVDDEVELEVEVDVSLDVLVDVSSGVLSSSGTSWPALTSRYSFASSARILFRLMSRVLAEYLFLLRVKRRQRRL